MARNAAIWPRVTDEAGQYLVLPSDGLQPLVIPAAAIASMLASWMLPSSSMNVPPGGKTVRKRHGTQHRHRGRC